MEIIRYIKATFYLGLVIIVAYLGLGHSIYGLAISYQNAEVYPIDYNNFIDVDLFRNRYLSISNAHSFADPVIFVNNMGIPVKYIYAISAIQDSSKFKTGKLDSHLLIESNSKIKKWNSVHFRGLLKPYWENIDPDVSASFKYSGINITEDAEILKLNTKPWKWYWHILVILLATLFFYRMFEAMFLRAKQKAL